MLDEFLLTMYIMAAVEFLTNPPQSPQDGPDVVEGEYVDISPAPVPVTAGGEISVRDLIAAYQAEGGL